MTIKHNANLKQKTKTGSLHWSAELVTIRIFFKEKELWQKLVMLFLFLSIHVIIVFS